MTLVVFGGRWAWTARRFAAPGLVARLAVLALLVVAPTFALVAPDLDRLWLSRGAAALVARHPPPEPTIAVVGYAEPSLVFLLGTKTRLVSAETAALYLTTARAGAALVSDRDDAAFRQALAARGWEARRIDSVAGIDSANGKRLVLSLYTGAPG